MSHNRGRPGAPDYLSSSGQRDVRHCRGRKQNWRQAMSVESQTEIQWDSAANRLWFEVDQDGEPVRCCIDALCLYLAFGASTLAEADATHAYISRRGWIHA